MITFYHIPELYVFAGCSSSSWCSGKSLVQRDRSLTQTQSHWATDLRRGLTEHMPQPPHADATAGGYVVSAGKRWLRRKLLKMSSACHSGAAVCFCKTQITSDQWRRLGCSALYLPESALGTTTVQKDTVSRDDTGLHCVFQGWWRPQACSALGSTPHCLPSAVAPSHFRVVICCMYNNRRLSPKQCMHINRLLCNNVGYCSF